MFSITLEMNQVCNLKCSYCYLGEKSGLRMSKETAEEAIHLAFEKAKLHKDGKLWFDFVGGEALIDFLMMQKLVAYIERMNTRYHYHLLYSVTTNATLLNSEIINFLAEKDFMLKISIDGNKQINDLNRISCGGFSVYDKVIGNMEYIRMFEKRTGKCVQVTNVITRNNYMHYYDTLVFLTRDLKFKFIDTAIDVSVDWSEKELNRLENEIRKSFDYFMEMTMNREGFWWEFANKVKNMKVKREKFYSCGAGIVSMYVRTDGSICPCSGNLDEHVSMGNVKKGIDRNKINDLLNFKDIENEKCHQCEIFDYCVEKACAMQNLAVMKDRNQPVPVFCRLRQLMYQIYLEHEEFIERLIWS